MEQSDRKSSLETETLSQEIESEKSLEAIVVSPSKKLHTSQSLHKKIGAYVLLCLVAGLAGFIIALPTSFYPSTTIFTEENEVGKRFSERFDGIEEGNASVSWFAFNDFDNNGKEATVQTEPPFSKLIVMIKKPGQEYPFSTIQTDAAGIATVRGMPAGEYEVSYQWYDQYSSFNANGWNIQTIYAYQKDGKVEVFPTAWMKFEIKDGEQKFFVPVRQYRPEQLYVIKNGTGVHLFDPDTQQNIGTMYPSSSQNLSYKKFELIDGAITYLNQQGNLASYSLSKGYEQEKIDRLNDFSTDMELLITSPDVKTIAYPLNSSLGSELRLRSTVPVCGDSNQVWYDNQTLFVSSASNPYYPLELSFYDGSTFAFLGYTAQNREFQLFNARCDGGRMYGDPLGLYPVEGAKVSPIFLNKDTLLLRGVFQNQPKDSAAETKKYGELGGDSHLYSISTKKLQGLGNILPTSSTLFSNDRSYLINIGEEIKIYKVSDLLAGNVQGVSIPKGALFTDTARNNDGRIWMNKDMLYIYDLYPCENDQLCGRVKSVQISETNFAITETVEVKGFSNVVELVGVLEKPYEQ